LNFSTDVKYKSFDSRWRYNRSWNRDVSGSNPSGGYDLTWPDVGLTLSGIEHVAPSLLTTSSLSSSYQRRTDFTGTYDFPTDTFQSLNRRVTTTDNLSPVLSWQATWKSKFTTTLSANYSNAVSLTYLEAERYTQTRNLSDNLALSLGYTFSAPHGLRLPGLKKLKFTSDLGVNVGFTYGNTLATTTGLDGQTVPSDNSRDIGTTLSLSYRFSNSIESGLNGGYTTHNNIQGGINTRTTSLNFWVLFKF
jgi:cell surface protein SprA